MVRTRATTSRPRLSLFLPRWERSTSGDQVEAVLASPAVNEEGSTVERKTSQERRHNPPERRGQERRSHVDAHLLDTRAKQERRLNSRRTEEQEAPAPETPSVPRKGIDVLA